MPEPHDPAAKSYTDREVKHLQQLLDQEIRGLREYVGQRIDSALEKMEDRFKAESEARTVAFEAQEEKLEKMNEFREENRKLTSTFATRELYERDIANLETRLRQLDDAAAATMPRAEIESRIAGNSERIGKLENSRIEQVGHQQGSQRTFQVIVMLIGLVIAIAGFALTYLAFKPRP